jgi:hypothetical protein
MFRIVLILLFNVSIAFSQSSKTEVDFEKAGVKSWASSSEFERVDIKAVDIKHLRKIFLNKNVTPIYISKEFREYKYKNFYHDKKLKRAFKNKKRNGFRENNNRGSLSTVVYYDPNTNYEFLYNQTFKVVDIFPIKSIKHVASTDDSNYIFVLENNLLGKLYYEYNSKFEDTVEIEISE